MAFRAVTDACALYPFSLRDTLLRLAAAELFDIYWSERILEEVSLNLEERGVATSAQASRLIEHMTAAFPAASVPAEQIAHLEPGMPNDEKDRHVLAAAVAAGAEALITFNLADFPSDACNALGVDPIHPDDFLLILDAISPQVIEVTLDEQAADLRNPPMTTLELLDSLAVAVPGFADAVRLRRTEVC